MDYEFDIAISFAGEERGIAEEFAEKLKRYGLKVFYDRFLESDLWGKDGYEYFVDVYAKKAKYCLMLISKHYAKKVWTNHERKAAQSRAIKEKEPYILPVRLDDTQIPGFIDTIFYQDLREKSVDVITELVLEKLGKKYSGSQHKTPATGKREDPFSNVRMPKIKKRFTDLEKEEFLEQGYEYLKNYLEKALQKLEQSEESIQTKFQEINNKSCAGRIYKDGKMVHGFKLWIGGFFNDQSISLRLGRHNIDKNDNSCNEIISVKEQDNQIMFNIHMGTLNFGNIGGPKSKEEIATYIWEAIIRPLEYQ